MGESSHFDVLAPLRATFPDWTFEANWITVASGPDRRHYLAHRGDTTVSAWSVDDLAAQVTAESIARALRETDES